MKKIILTLAFSFFAVICFAGEAMNAQQPFDANVSIKFYNRRIYYPGNDTAEPIFVKIAITNTGTEPLRFKLANDRMFSLDFSALTTKNRELPHTEPWIRKRNTNQHIYFREITIETGETYSFIENLKEYIVIQHPGVYVLSADFYPELKRLNTEAEFHVKSNRLSLEVKPALSAAALSSLPVSLLSDGILQPQPLSPDKVISYLLTARQKSHWDEFFLYLDIERMIGRDPARNRRFTAEPESGRMDMINTYKHELIQARTDKDIAIIPVQYEIERTTYNATEAEVTVIEWFAYSNFREKKRFTYYLSSRDDIWTVYDYTVDNLGTE
ncbi:MAG: hypothetical protein ACTTJ7_08575 [Treponema sp.]